MKKKNTKLWISVCLKVLVAVFAIWGLYKSLFSDKFMGGSTLLLYFTIQSNVWIAVVDILIIIMQLKGIKKDNFVLNQKWYLAQEIFTVSITLTGFVYCFVLLPSFISQGYTAGGIFSEYRQIFLHVITPLLSVVDLIGFTRHAEFKKKQSLWAIFPPVYYLIFAAVGYFAGWNFGGGANYPYFFLNYGSEVGLFGFGGEMPYFMGSVYWIIALTLFVIGISLLYITIINHLKKRNEKKITTVK